MRTIKFRAWDKERKEMLAWNISNSFASDVYFLIYDKEMPLMQYTGLKDKNGKEIYEGDIVQYDWTISDKAVIEWDETFFRWAGKIKANYIPLAGRAWKRFEVIGNIYENPELLA